MVKHSLRVLFTFSASLVILLPGLSQSAIKAHLTTPANAGNLSESCGGPYELVLERSFGNTDTTLINITDVGIAQESLDYSFPAGFFPYEMLPDESVVIVAVDVVDDGTPEGLESLIWDISYVAGLKTGSIQIESSIVDEYEVDITAASDTLQWCRYAPLQLEASSSSEINWSPSPAFSPSTGSSVTVFPFASGWYYATVGTDVCGAKDSIYLDLAIANIGNMDTVYICKGSNGVVLNGELLGLASGFKWIPSDSTLSDTNILTPIANPVITTTYILQTDFGVCISADTVVVRVDSLPQDLHIDIAPAKAYYCEGEIVALFSSSFDSLKFPDLTFKWNPFDNTFLSDSNYLNAALQLIDTTTYFRVNTNNACVSVDSITINVVTSGIPLSLTDTLLCPGKQFQVHVLSNQVTEPEWMPETGLSCSQCLNPTVTVIGTPGSTLVYEFSGMILQCPVGASFTVNIPPVALINISANDNVVCIGDVVSLTLNNPEDITNYHWQVDAGNASLSCNDCPNPMLTVNGVGAIHVTIEGDSPTPDRCGAFGDIFIAYGMPAQIPVVGDNVVCEGDVVPLSITNPQNYTNIVWSVTQGNASLSCTSCLSPNVTINGSGQVTVHVSGLSTDPNFCGADGEFILKHGAIKQLPETTLRACKDGTVIATTGDPNVIAYQWNINGPPGNLTLSCTECPNPTVTFHATGSSLQFFADSNIPDTCGITGFVSVAPFASDTGTILISPDPSMNDIGQGMQVTAMLQVNGGIPTNIMWTVNGVSVPGTGTTISFNANEDENVVQVHFTNSHGCDEVAMITFPTVPPMYKIPNAFTPDNGDDINDKFKVIILGNIVLEKFQIFNRWGQLVYKASDNDQEGWDGYFKGSPAASDTYVYTAELRFPNGHIEVAKGDLLLIK